MKTRVISEESRKAIAFLKHISVNGKDEVEKSLPMEAPRNDLSQIQILAALMQRIYDKELRSVYGLPIIEWRLLEATGIVPGITAAEFAQYWVFDKVTVSRALQALKKRGLVASRPHATDKRRAELHYTDAGRVILEEQRAVKEWRLAALAEVLTEDEMKTFTDLARKLVDYFRRVDQESDRLLAEDRSRRP